MTGTRWTFTTVTVSLSRLSTEYVEIPVSVSVNGQPYDPTGDVVQFAFLNSSSAVPQASDWHAGSWDTTALGGFQHLAKCLIGPAAGALPLAAGQYSIWISVTDSPEVPVQGTGTLTIY